MRKEKKKEVHHDAFVFRLLHGTDKSTDVRPFKRLLSASCLLFVCLHFSLPLTQR